MEEYAFVLDHLAQGTVDSKRIRREPVTFALGESEFKLLELTPKDNITMGIGDRVYIGKDPALRDKILHVKRRISWTDLTTAAQNEVPYLLETIVKRDEIRFVKFFNEAEPVSTRFHTLELIPGLGKKTMWAVVEERKKRPFETLASIGDRVAGIRDPAKLIAKRIQLELSDPQEKYRLFVAR